MTVVFERRNSRSARWARRLAVFSAVLLLTATAGHRFAFLETIPFFWLLGLVLALAVISLVLAGFGFFRLWEYGDRGGRASTRAVLVALVVLLPFAYAGYTAFMLPRLTEVSTDVSDPPLFVRALALRKAGMNPIGPILPENAALQRLSYPEVTGRRYPLLADRTHDIVVAVLDTLGWRVTRNQPVELEGGEMTMEAEARSPILGLVSDVAIRIVDEGETSYIDIRSVSRYGPHDLGDNAAKVRRFFQEIETEIMARNAPVIQTE